MPPIPKKTICRICGKVTQNADRYCDEHKDRKKDYDKWRGSPSSRGYDFKWTKFRKHWLREHSICEKCGMEATEIHHIQPLSEGGSKYSEFNLMPLCHSCHSKITASSIKQ